MDTQTVPPAASDAPPPAATSAQTSPHLSGWRLQFMLTAIYLDDLEQIQQVVNRALAAETKEMMARATPDLLAAVQSRPVLDYLREVLPIDGASPILMRNAYVDVVKTAATASNQDLFDRALDMLPGIEDRRDACWLAIKAAAGSGNLELVSSLVEHDRSNQNIPSSLQPFRRDCYGEGLLGAVRCGSHSREILKLLFDSNVANLDLPICDGSSPLPLRDALVRASVERGGADTAFILDELAKRNSLWPTEEMVKLLIEVTVSNEITLGVRVLLDRPRLFREDHHSRAVRAAIPGNKYRVALEIIQIGLDARALPTLVNDAIVHNAPDMLHTMIRFGALKTITGFDPLLSAVANGRNSALCILLQDEAMAQGASEALAFLTMLVQAPARSTWRQEIEHRFGMKPLRELDSISRSSLDERHALNARTLCCYDPDPWKPFKIGNREPVSAVEMATKPGFPENLRDVILNHAIRADTFVAATEDVETLAAASNAAREEVAARRTASRRPR